MDIYQIIITHNRSWTIREIIAFAVVFLMAVFLAAVLLRLHKIVIIQAVCGLLLLTFLAIVFGSMNNPVPVSLLSGDRKPQIRFLENHHSGSGNLYYKSFRM